MVQVCLRRRFDQEHLHSKMDQVDAVEFLTHPSGVFERNTLLRRAHSCILISSSTSSISQH